MSIQQLPEVNHLCLSCYKPATKKCSDCKKAYYCAIQCQKNQWQKGHRQACKQQREILELKQCPSNKNNVELAGLNKTDQLDIIFGDPQSEITIKNCTLVAERKILFLGKKINITASQFCAKEITFISLGGFDLGNLNLGKGSKINVGTTYNSPSFSTSGSTLIATSFEGAEERLLSDMEVKRTFTSNIY